MRVTPNYEKYMILTEKNQHHVIMDLESTLLLDEQIPRLEAN